MKNYMLTLAVTAAAVSLVSMGAMANDKMHKTTVATSTPGNTNASNDDSGMNNDAAAHDKVGTIPGESTPGDVKTSNDDSGMNNDAAKNDKVGTVPGESTPGDVKTSDDDSGMNNDDAAHDKVAEHDNK